RRAYNRLLFEPRADDSGQHHSAVVDLDPNPPGLAFSATFQRVLDGPANRPRVNVLSRYGDAVRNSSHAREVANRRLCIGALLPGVDGAFEQYPPVGHRRADLLVWYEH